MNQLEELFDEAKYNALEYVKLYRAPDSDVESILRAIVSEHGREVFCDLDTLLEEMTEAGASEAEFCQVYLMTQVSGFWELLRQDQRTFQQDLDRYIQNATEETGFNRDRILCLTNSILSSIGGAMNHTPAPADKAAFPPRPAALLASSLYAAPLRAFQAEFDKVRANPSAAKLDFDQLEFLANLGIPRAKYYLGYCLLNGVQVEASEERGRELLREAADMGDSKAAAALGDYYYALGGSDHWTQAYQYYTGYGAAALDSVGKAHIISILNQQRFNRKLLRLCAVLLAVCAVVMVFQPAAALYGAHPVWGRLMIAAQLALLVLGHLYHRVRPYDFIYWLPASMSGLWFVYMVIRLLF